MPTFQLVVRQRRRPFMPSSDPRARVTVSITTATAGVTVSHASTPMPVQTVAGRAMRAARVALRSRANPALDLPSPVCVHRLKQYLGAYDAGLRDALVDGFSHGFRIPSYINRSVVSTTGYTNHSSACVHANFVSTKLDHELALGRVAGPFARPTPPNLIISPLRVVPKKTPVEYRLIHD